ncbi:MAG TPA: C-terminal binding protein [Actinomycetota bacterium]|nr:C-terminal binding protein [Actinomycetota bacterium]
MGIVVVTDHVFAHLDQEREILAAAGHELRYEGNLRTADEVREAVGPADAVLNCYAPIPAEVISATNGCRIVARYGIGLDTVDIPAASAMGIVVTNVPDYCIDEVSDHALALILALGRGIARLDRSVRAGSWDAMVARPLHRLRDETLGLIGFGRIARRLAEKAGPIGFRILATDPYLPSEVIGSAGVEPMDLPSLLERSDVVSVHAPLTEESRHLLGASELGRMRPGAFLINTSRGPLVDLDALLDALEAGRLGGAALDVLEEEPPDPDHPLLRRDDVVMTPHTAFYSEESMAEQQRKAAEQVVAALAGTMPSYAVNARDLVERSG